MKFLYIIFLIISVNKAFAQDILSLAKQDTVYVILPETETLTSLNYNGFKYSSSGNGRENEGHFYTTDKYPISIYTKKIDDKNLRVKRKTFFRKNNHRIIDLKVIETYSPKKVFFETFRLREPRTVVYVINENELKRRKIIIKKAFVYTESYIEM